MKDKTDREKELTRAENLGEVLDSKMAQSTEIPPRLKQLLGLCATCTSCHYHKTQLMDEIYMCERRSNFPGTKLNTSDPVIECSAYGKRGDMTLWDMKEMATLVDPPKRKPGFKRYEDED